MQVEMNRLAARPISVIHLDVSGVGEDLEQDPEVKTDLEVSYTDLVHIADL